MFPSSSLPSATLVMRIGSLASADCALFPTGKVVVATLPTSPITRLPPPLAAMTEIALFTSRKFIFPQAWHCQSPGIHRYVPREGCGPVDLLTPPRCSVDLSMPSPCSGTLLEEEELGAEWACLFFCWLWGSAGRLVPPDLLTCRRLDADSTDLSSSSFTDPLARG